MSHTKGPWDYTGHPGASMPLLHVYCSDDKGPAHESRSTAEVEANARLIAAAPALLEALKELHEIVLRNGLAHTKKADAALKQAGA